MYELLAGQCAFKGSLVSIIGQVLHTEPRPLSDVRPDMPRALADICAKAIAKDSGQRYASMKEFAAALSSFLKGSTAVRVSEPQAAAPDTIGGLEELLSSVSMHEGTPLQSLPTRKPASPKPANWVWALGGAGAVTVLLLVCFILLTRNQPATNPDDSTVARTTDATLTSPSEGRSSAAHEATVGQPSTATVGADVAAETAPDEVNQSQQSEGRQNASPAPGSDGDPPPFGPEPPVGRGFDADLEKVDSFPRLKQFFERKDTNHDWKLDPREVPLHIIMRADTNDDRLLTPDELKRAFTNRKQRLFAKPSADEMRRLPRRPPGGEGEDHGRPPFGRPGPYGGPPR
jgi:hypothetical protein